MTSKIRDRAKQIVLLKRIYVFFKLKIQLGKSNQIKQKILLLDYDLWRGFAAESKKELRKFIDSNIPPDCKALAKVFLAKRSFFEGNYSESAKMLKDIKPLKPVKFEHLKQKILIESLVSLGDFSQAEKLFKKYFFPRMTKNKDPNLYFLFNNVLMRDSQDMLKKRMDVINSILNESGFSNIVLTPSDRLIKVGSSAPDTYKEGSLVSIIMPMYNSEKTIKSAIEGLLSQTWRSLEIIVVDDCSDDQSVAEVEKLMQSDNRIKLIKHSKNQGAYKARNTGLSHSNGKYITIHDSDDWSHPQKIECQVLGLENDKSCIGNYSFLVRVNSQMRAIDTTLNFNFVKMNTSSLLIRRHIFDEIGSWDNLRVGADTEFLWRLKAVYPEKIKPIMTGVPLTFSRVTDSSLTSSTRTHIMTSRFGVRREHLETAKVWHENQTRDELKRKSRFGLRDHLPVAGFILSSKRDVLEANCTLISDFSNASSFTQLNKKIIKFYADQGIELALFHWGKRLQGERGKVSSYYRRLALKKEVKIISPGENVCCKNILVLSPPNLLNDIDFTPTFGDIKSLIFLNHNRVQKSRIRKVEAKAKNLFGIQPRWIDKKMIFQEFGH